MTHDGSPDTSRRRATPGTSFPSPSPPKSAEALARLGAALGLADTSALAALEVEVRSQMLASGSVLFREGDASDAMYLVLRAELEVALENPEQGTMVVGRIGPGEPVGEMQILSGGPRPHVAGAFDPPRTPEQRAAQREHRRAAGRGSLDTLLLSVAPPLSRGADDPPDP